MKPALTFWQHWLGSQKMTMMTRSEAWKKSDIFLQLDAEETGEEV
jgi:hypothetical protein